MAPMDEHSIVYQEEARELLTDLEDTLLEMEDNPTDSDLISRAFRDLHTIKGSGAMFGFDDIAAFTHQLETVFDLVRNGEMTVTRELIDLTLQAKDHIRYLLEAAIAGDEPDKSQGDEIIENLKTLIPSQDGGDGYGAAQEAVKAEEAARNVTYRIRFKPNLELFLHGTNPVCLLDELRRLGDSKIIAYTEGIPPLSEYSTELCYTYWDIILTTNLGVNAIKDVFIFVEDECTLTIDVIDREDESIETDDYKKLGEILVERGDISPNALEKILGGKKLIGELLVDAGLVSKDKVESALQEQQHVKEIRKSRKTPDQEATIKVPSGRLDRLVDLVGELVIAQARLSQIAATRNDPDLLSIAETMERLTVDLRDNSLTIRMLPIGTTFGKFRRLVRDLANELGREVELTTDGAETELDKTVIEKLNDPLVHLIRNSIDHGIEPPEERELKGKPRQGRVHLSALHSGAHVLISIKDDGAGLDRDAIFNKAVEKGLIAADAQMSDKELYSLILHPGFSTAKKLTSVSGRGVGMDVVKQCIDSLRGTIEINSVRGEGTTLTLKLPLTLAIIEGLLVKVDSGHYVIPLSVVEECIELTRDDIDRTHGRNLIRVRGEIVPYVHLRHTFSINGSVPDIQQVVVTRLDGHRIGFTVDQVIGEHQTVIKSLGRMYRELKGISGATILGDGNVALILDIPQLMEEAESEERDLCYSKN